MRIQKLLVLIYIAAIGGAVFQQAKADDTEMQKRARELLRQNMATNTPVPDATPAVPPAAPAAPVAPAAPAPVAVPAPVVTPPAVEAPVAVPSMPVVEKSVPVPAAAPALNQSVEDQLRANMRQTMAEQAATNQTVKKTRKSSYAGKPAPGATQPSYPVYPPPSIKENPPLVAPVAPQVVPTAVPTTELGDVATSQTNGVSSVTDQELREKMRARMAQLESENKVSSKPPTASDYGAMPQGYNTPGPAPVIAPGSKDQKLADLLAQYKADQITPAEYHTKRAEIIAGP